MSETTATTDGNDSGTTSTADEFKAITSQEELNKVLKDRIDRERSKFSDYNDLRAKAAKLEQIEQANQTELEKAQNAANEAAERAKAAEIQMLRYRVAAKHGISDDDAEMFLTAADEDVLTRQAERLAARNAEASSPRAPKPDANQGRSGAGGPKSTADSFAEFFRNNLSER